MKRFHVHVAVADLGRAISFYSTMFGAEPAVVKDDYAKWMLEDPRVNFAISQRGAAVGVNHLGFQVDGDAELEQIGRRLEAADQQVLAEKGVACCYAKSDKYWVKDPAGIPWETFRTLGTVPLFDGDEAASGCCGPETPKEKAGACCTPEQKAATRCCA